ncbi:cAMP-binding protein [Reichenbachiella sp. 5M10]|uniref:Crp/Fnr family transcriptional regulator n=1 Tax=Reichenbachiella sp. 5M10 TaxID=1889772 RepID=UPI000C150AB7|nr:Crp/Fnr family transcriptional regulator [Reichenbachiella sp. 5M10]PIB35335.1 cAMP-binding protein [Reichenbachiella sp. 5M10]
MSFSQTTAVKDYLHTFGLLSDREQDALVRLLKPKTLKKGELYIREGEDCREVAFVLSGVLRSFYYSSDSEDVTYCFRFKNSFVTAYSAFISGEKSTENIQALTQVELLILSREQIGLLEQTSINWLKFFKQMAEQEYIYMERRVFLLQRESAEKRYEDLLRNQPEYLQLVPLRYLASYLGITQRHLSRIRKSISI